MDRPLRVMIPEPDADGTCSIRCPLFGPVTNDRWCSLSEQTEDFQKPGPKCPWHKEHGECTTVWCESCGAEDNRKQTAAMLELWKLAHAAGIAAERKRVVEIARRMIRAALVRESVQGLEILVSELERGEG